MRPIDKGACPEVQGVRKTVTDYRAWRNDLIHRIGYYCVYCNMPLSHQLNVEHVEPKKPRPSQPAGDPLAWENMLLACESCNKTKSNKSSDETIHYLPEHHNGLLAFDTAQHPSQPNSLIVIPKAGLNKAQQAKAARTIADFGLDQVDTRGAIVDIRWLRRHDAAVVVRAAKDLLDMAKTSPNYDADKAGRLVATQAAGTGFFSLWFEAFEHEPEVIKSLIDPTIIPGTAQSCFDSANGYRPIAGAGLTQPPPSNP